MAVQLVVSAAQELMAVVPVLVGAFIAFATAFFFRKLDHRRRRLAFKAQARALLALMQSRLSVDSVIYVDDDTFDRTILRLESLYFSDHALLAISTTVLDSACGLLVALDQLRSTGRGIDREKRLRDEISMTIAGSDPEASRTAANIRTRDRLESDIADHRESLERQLKKCSQVLLYHLSVLP